MVTKTHQINLAYNALRGSLGCVLFRVDWGLSWKPDYISTLEALIKTAQAVGQTWHLFDLFSLYNEVT